MAEIMCPGMGLVDVASNKPVPLKSVDVAVHVKGLIVNVTSHLQFTNDGTVPIEAIYKFPMDDKSVVYEFEATTEGRTIVAECQEKQQAKQTYQDALDAGYAATYMEQDDRVHDMFTCKVGNLPEKAELKVKFSYVTEFNVKADGSLNFVLHTLLNPKYGPNLGGSKPTTTLPVGSAQQYTFKFRAEVEMSSEIVGVSGGSKDTFHVDYNETKTTAKVSLTNEFVADHELELNITTKEAFGPHVLIEKGNSKKESIMKEDVLMLNFVPELDNGFDFSAKKEFIFVIDRSGSMGGERIQIASETLLLFLKSLPQDCYFNIVGFGSQFDKLFPEGSKKNSQETVEAALKYQKSLDADFGGTEILQPLEDIYGKECLPSYPRQIFLLTDGQVFNTDQVIKLVGKNSMNSRVFAFGIGEGASTTLVNGIARAGKGKAEFIKDNKHMKAVVMKAMKMAMQSSVTDLILDWQLGGSVKPVQLPSTLPPLYAGDRLVVYALTTGQPVLDGMARLKGKVGERPIEFSVSISSATMVSSIDDSAPIHRLAAKAQIQQLQDEENDSNKEEKKSAVILLSTAANVVSHHTAMVGVDKERSYKVTGQRTQVEVPLMTDPSLQFLGAPKMMMCSAPMGRSRGGAGHVAYQCAAFSGPMMAPMSGPPMACDASAMPGAPIAIKGAVCVPESLDMMEEDDTMELQVEEATSGYMKVVELQEFDGSWKLSDRFGQVVGKTRAEIEAGNTDKLPTEAWTTALAVSLLRLRYADSKDEWELIECKAIQWLQTHGVKDVEKVIGLAAKFIDAK